MPSRFWAKVDREAPGGCWLWTGARNSDGYGHIRIGGGAKNGRMVLAHRVMYEAFYGPIPDGLSILHRCDVPPCVTPWHLRVGTATDNLREAYERKRRIPTYGRRRKQEMVAADA